MNGDRAAKVERVRVRFAREAEAAEIGHLDLTRAWERALSESGVPVSYSSGRKHQARITIAAGLAQGVTSDGELVDVFLSERMPEGEVVARASAHLPAGLRVIDAREVGLGLPSLPASLRWAEYEVRIAPLASGTAVEEAILRFRALESLPWEEKRGERMRHYDLRPLVSELRIENCGEAFRLFMRLRCDSLGVGRPDQVVKALGLPDALSVHRLRLILDEPSPARDAWRRRGRFRA